MMASTPEPPMPTPPVPEPASDRYRPYFRDGMVLVRWWTLERAPILAEAATANLLRGVLRSVQAQMPFQMVGFMILPDHVLLLIRPEGLMTAARITSETRRRYQRLYPQLVGSPAAMRIWADDQALAAAESVASFARFLDRLHYAPVQHGLVERPEDWTQSSYAAWVERGLYKLGWGWQCPRRLADAAP